MKRIMISISLLLLVLFTGTAENRLNIGGGYFGETAVYPGAVAEIEREKIHTEAFTAPLRASLGFFVHPRSSTGVFLDIQTGFRKYSKKGFFLEQYIGIGALVSFYNEDVFHVEGSSVARVSNFGNFDVMPSVTLGMGQRFKNRGRGSSVIFLRPKLYWQIPFNNIASPHIAFQAGYSHTIKGGR